MNEGLKIIEQYQYNEYRRKHSHSLDFWVWMTGLGICAVFVVLALVL